MITTYLHTDDFSVLTAPAASMLTLQFSQRAVIMAGGLLAASGMLLASLDLSLPWLYLSMGFLQGKHTDCTNSFLSFNKVKMLLYLTI